MIECNACGSSDMRDVDSERIGNHDSVLCYACGHHELRDAGRVHIEFTVPAIPIAQPRPRAMAFAGHARVYEPKQHPVAAFKASVRMAAKEAYSGPPLQGPLRVDCTFVFPRPKSMIWKKRPMQRERHAKKPDRDNCDKAVLDALSGLMWADDCQVCAGQIEKWIAGGYEQPRVIVVVSEVT